ncbi:MAG: putative lipoprotein, partial [candidate division CPR2 bacterium GW2011_GWD1_39_7]
MKLKFKNNKGFTLIEMVVVVALIPLLFVGISEVFIFTSNNYHYANNVRKVTQEVRGALEAIARETRSAKSLTVYTKSDPVEADRNKITLRTKDDVDMSIWCNNCTDVSTSGAIKVKVGGDPEHNLTSDLAEVTKFEISDEKATGNITPFAKITVTVRSKEADNRGNKPSVTLGTMFAKRDYFSNLELNIDSFTISESPARSFVPVTFSATATSSGFLAIDSYEWEFYLDQNDAATCATVLPIPNTISTVTQTATCTYANPGTTYIARVVVKIGGMSAEKKLSVPVVVGIPVVSIGSQVWMATNINTGTRVDGSSAQTIDQKYCYGNVEANCTANGGLYLWNTAMSGNTAERAQGICPTGFHIPIDAEWYILENNLKDTEQPCSDTRNGHECSSAGTKLKNGGSSGLNMLLGGYRYPGGTYFTLANLGGYY